ncbi:MAG TPA: branched-chain amino acid ABC transporter substrate-binding protein [bacterium]|jgi:branched-chain amino acid transport system substrate-binding protein|nr:branched-chain amino acid ABC transporter substrate-binding protein [bacterium]
MRHVRLLLALFVALLLAGGSYFVPGAPAAQTMGPVTDQIGVVKINKGQPITIAYWLVISGPDASLGVDSRRGIEIAIDDAKGTLVGHPIRLIGEDSGCNAEGGTTAATKLAANKAIVAAIGSTCSSEARPGAPILWKAGIVTVSPSNTAPVLTAPDRGPDYGGYLRTAHNDSVQGKVAATFVTNVLKLKKAATIHDGSPYAEGLANVFADVFTRLNGAGSITSREAISPTDTDMRPVLTKIAAGKPELIYFPVFIAAGGFIARQAKEVSGLGSVKLMSADGTFSPDFQKAAGEAAIGMYNSSPDLSPEALGPGYKVFLDKHQKKYKEKPISAFHPHAYDAANIIFAAIRKVAKKDAAGNTYIGRKALRDALFATKAFKGLTGTLTCNEFGDCADPKIAVYQTISVDPAKWNPGTNPKKIYP